MSVFPTARDIYIEINGRRLAVAQSYRVKSSRDTRYIESFGAPAPVGTVAGRQRHVVELTRLYVTGGGFGDGVDFYSLENFNIVVVKPDRKIIFSGCQWSSVQEQGDNENPVAEKLTAVAAGRMEVKA